jgi:hypothetical protein
MVPPIQGGKGVFAIPPGLHPGLKEFKPFRLVGEKASASKIMSLSQN